ncbi:MAG: PIN domain-containing protein [Metallosphaera yellowstonensis]|jgi:predicted nucleic acid-binding protein|nr:PIN domain-containing protein [Metallosphaera yellowstonensis]
MYAVISPSSYPRLKEILSKFSQYKLVITTFGVSYALKNNLDIDFALDKGVWVRAYSHKVFSHGELPIHEAEAIMVASDLQAILIASDEKVKAEAERRGVKVVSPDAS